jgi:hypothetical protein
VVHRKILPGGDFICLYSDICSLLISTRLLHVHLFSHHPLQIAGLSVKVIMFVKLVLVV